MNCSNAPFIHFQRQSITAGFLIMQTNEFSVVSRSQCIVPGIVLSVCIDADTAFWIHAHCYKNHGWSRINFNKPFTDYHKICRKITLQCVLCVLHCPILLTAKLTAKIIQLSKTQCAILIILFKVETLQHKMEIVWSILCVSGPLSRIFNFVFRAKTDCLCFLQI